MLAVINDWTDEYTLFLMVVICAIILLGMLVCELFKLIVTFFKWLAYEIYYRYENRHIIRPEKYIRVNGRIVRRKRWLR